MTHPGTLHAPGRADSPPALLPGEHFALGLCSLLAGTAGMVWVAPELAAGAFVAPRVAAITHLWTLGWITTSILGALYQFLPVALGVPIRSIRAAYASFALLTAGIPSLAVGLAFGIRASVHAGATMLALALTIAAMNVLATLVRAETRSVTFWALLGATVSLLGTLSLGTLLAIAGRGMGPGPFTLLGVHVHLALGGFVLLVVVGVARHLLPMFLLSHGAPAWPSAAATALLAAGAASLVAPLAGLGWWPPAVLLTAGVAALVGQAFMFHRHRVRRRLDPGMRLAGVGLAVLLLGVGVGWVLFLAGEGEPRLMTAYGLLLVTSLSLFVAGHYYKIVPFLIWLHRFGPAVGKSRVPRVADLTSPRLARVAGTLLVAGVLAAASGVLVGEAWLIRAAGLSAFAGALVEATQLGAALRRRTA